MTMSSTVAPSPPSSQGLSIESLPTVDLRLLTQSELNALSQSSTDLWRCNDVVIPEIDRSVFNESAGSRKQTYSRLRLVPRNTTTITPPPTRTRTRNNGDDDEYDMNKAGCSSFSFSSSSSLDYDNSRIISLFKTLFNNINESLEYSDATTGEKKRKMMNNLSITMTKDEENDNEKEKGLVNGKGEVVDLRELGKEEDPYGEEIRRRTEGKESSEELLGFISDLNGQWGSRKMKRKIVDANVFGHILPLHWKLLIAIKKKLGCASVFCRRYISPNGRYFVSCKEVSSYLLSLTSPGDIKQQPTVECLEDVMEDKKLASESATDLVTKVDPSLSIAPDTNDDENVQKPLSTFQTIDHEKQLSVVTNVLSGGQAASALKCHKCSSAFGEKDELLNHLLSCHKRKRRKSGAPIEDDIMMKAGKYECQFCNKVFHERSSYFGHVGNHVKNHMKNIGGSPGLTMVAKQKDSFLGVVEVPVTVSTTVKDVEMNVDSVSSVPNTFAGGDLNFNSAVRNPEACSEATSLENSEVGLNNVEVRMETAQINKMPVDGSSGKLDNTAHTADNNSREVEGAVDFTAMKPDKCFVSEGENNNENNDLCVSLGKINGIDRLNFEITKASPEPMENDETDFVSDSKQADLGNDDNVAVNILQSDREASESDLLFENNEASSDDQNSEDRLLVNNTVRQSCFAEDLELGDDDDRLIDGSDSGHLDLGIDAGDDIQCPRSLDETSDVLHTEEEAYGTTAKGIEFVESSLAESNENSSCSPSGDQPTMEMQNVKGNGFIGIASVTEVGTCGLEDSEAVVDADMSDSQEQPETCASLQSKDDGYGYVVDEDETVAHMKLVKPGETGCFQVEQTCSLVNSPRELSNKKSEDSKRDQVMNSDLFFAPKSNGRYLTADIIASNDQAHGDVSNLLGTFYNFVEDKQEEDPKNNLSGLSLNQHMREVSMNNMLDAPSTATPTQLPELDEGHSSRTNKLIFDFGSITDIDSSLLGPVQNESIPEGTSPFSLWGQKSCTFEDNQNRVYGSARDAVQQERSSDRNSLNLIGIQQPSDVGCNLNKVCINEQTYGVQHYETEVYRKNNEIGREGIYGSARGLIQQERASDNNLLNLVGLQQPPDAVFNLNKVHTKDQRYGVQHNESGVFSMNNEARTERIPHGNTHNLASFQRQCDTGYNLNKSCINQQGYGVQCSETGAYSTSYESKQGRVTYGNSLRLASVLQTCEPRYAMNKACIPQTCDTGFVLNKGYVGTNQGLPKLDELGHSRDQDLIASFGNSGAKPNQGVATDFLWRAAEGNILHGGFMDSSSSLGQQTVYQAFDFLSDKGGNNLYASNEKFDNISSFRGLRPTSVEPMEFSFMTPQDSNSHLGHKNVLAFNAQLNQGFGSSVWHQKPTQPYMMGGPVVSILCVWCGNEFHQDSLSCQTQAGSIGYLCPTCKARMSGQFL